MCANNCKLRLLLVDDHEVVRRGLKEVLRAERDLQVVGEASNGHEAVEAARRLKPAIAIIDIEMPGMDGIEATQRIRTALPLIKILIFTLHRSEELMRQALEAGARGLVLKSDFGDSLLSAIHVIARGEVYLAPAASEIVVRGFVNAGKSTTPGGATHQLTTPRETDVIRLLAVGKANKEVAAALGITVKTAESYRTRVMAKLGMHSVCDLVRHAIRHNLIAP